MRTHLAILLSLAGACQAAPQVFEENCGQTDARVRYLSRASDHVAFFTSDAIVFRLPSAAVRMSAAGANRRATLEPLDRLPGLSNYFVGRNPARWRTGVRQFGGVRYRDLYPGIDLVFRGGPEYDFVVAPGAHPGDIRLAFEGATAIRIEDGDLVLDTGTGQLRHRRPLVYQASGGKRTIVSGRYRLAGRQVSFEVGAYDRERPLVIDPVVSYVALLGPRPYPANPGPPALDDRNRGGAGIAVDAEGSAYIVGSTLTADFPVTPGAFQESFASTRLGANDLFVTRLDPSGAEVQFSTFLGGSDDDLAADIAVDADGNAFVTGTTASDDFPIAGNPIQPAAPALPAGQKRSNVFVSILDASGAALLYSTYLGGTGADRASSIAVDAASNAYVAGETTSPDFPVTIGAFRTTPVAANDSFVAKIAPNSDFLVYSTRLTESDSTLGAVTSPFRTIVKVDAAGNAYVAGQSHGHDLPTRAFPPGGKADAYVLKLNTAGSGLLYAAYLGGSSDDGADGLAIDSDGNAYLAGHTGSPDFPATPNSFQPAPLPDFPPAGGPAPSYGFIAKLSTDGVYLLYATYLGGGDGISPAGIVVDSAGDAYATGSYDGPNFPLTYDAAQACIGNAFGQPTGYLFVLDPDGVTPLYSSYIGGNVRDRPSAIALDHGGAVYLTGATDSTAFQATSSPSGDPQGPNWVAKVDLSVPTPRGITCIANAAGLFGGAVAPAEVVSIFGQQIGSDVSTADTSLGEVATTLNGIRVLFDGIEAPVLYVSPNQINAIVPYATAFRTQTLVEVDNLGTVLPAVVVPVRPSAPALYTQNASGMGPLAAMNADGNWNAADHPAAPGSTVRLLASGLEPFDNDVGRVPTAPESAPVTPPAIFIGGIRVTPSFVGSAPGQPLAVVRIDVTVPPGVAPGPAVPVVFGTGENYQRLTLAVGTPSTPPRFPFDGPPPN